MTNIYIFIGVGILTLFIAAINYINLSTAQSFTRIKEIGIRKVTGAARGTIIAQFMGESFLLVFAAFTLSVVAAQLMLPAFNTIISDPITGRSRL